MKHSNVLQLGFNNKRNLSHLLRKCLQKFYLSARRRDGTFYNKKSLTAIRAALDRHLRSPPLNKPFSIIGDPLFTEANKSLSNYLKTLSKRADIARTAHKQALTKEVVEKLYDEGELVELENYNKLHGSLSVFSSAKEAGKTSIP